MTAADAAALLPLLRRGDPCHRQGQPRARRLCRPRHLGQAVGPAPALLPRPACAGDGRAAAAAEEPAGARQALRYRAQHRRRGSGPAGAVPGPGRGAGARSRSRRLERHRHRRPGLPEALPVRARLADRPCPAQRAPVHGAAGQGCLLGQRDQARPGGRAGRLPGLYAQGLYRRRLPRLCKKLLAAQDAIFPQFATHNAYSLAAVLRAGPGAGTTSSSACTAWARHSTTRWSGPSAWTGRAGSMPRSARTRPCSPIWSAGCWRTAPTRRSSTGWSIPRSSIDELVADQVEVARTAGRPAARADPAAAGDLRRWRGATAGHRSAERGRRCALQEPAASLAVAWTAGPILAAATGDGDGLPVAQPGRSRRPRRHGA